MIDWKIKSKQLSFYCILLSNAGICFAKEKNESGDPAFDKKLSETAS
jgi:hypothetical protein